MLEFSPSFPLEQLEEKIKENYFDEEVYTYLLETLKEDSHMFWTPHACVSTTG